MFGKDWQAAQGRVVDRVVVSHNNQDGVLVHDYIIDVQLPDGELYRARVGEPKIATDFWDPTIGQVVGVQYDAKSRKVRFDKSDPGISAKAQRRARSAEFEARLDQPAGTAAQFSRFPAGQPASPPASAQPVTADQLQTLLAGLSSAQVVRLDPNDPNAQALRQDLLARFAGHG